MAQKWRRSKEYRRWRVAVIRRDKGCVICGSRKHREAHHIACASYHPDQRFDVSNGVTLCRKHHTIFHTSFKRSFREKATKYDWEQFLELLHRMDFKLYKDM